MKKELLTIFILLFFSKLAFSQKPHGMYTACGRQSISVYDDTILCLSKTIHDENREHHCLDQRSCFIGSYHIDKNNIYLDKNKFYEYAIDIDSTVLHNEDIEIDIICDNYDEQFFFTLSKLEGRKENRITVYNKNHNSILITKSKYAYIFKHDKNKYKRKKINGKTLIKWIGIPISLEIKSFDLKLTTPIILQYGKKYTIHYKYPVDMAKEAMPDNIKIEYNETSDTLILKSGNNEEVFIKKTNNLEYDLNKQLLYMLRN